MVNNTSKLEISGTKEKSLRFGGFSEINLSNRQLEALTLLRRP